ncbi:hypothetical protein ALC56_09094, partial [Trachymyrmex septentrionalis]
AKGCTNSLVKGFKIVYFPKDVERRAKWIINMNRANWVPIKNSTLCEIRIIILNYFRCLC